MAASAIDDSVASLNIESDNLHTNRSNAKIFESDIQPTRKSTIQSLLAMETQAADFIVEPTATVGTVFYQTPVIPIGLTSTVTTRVEWISRMFRYWTGDLKIKIVFTKTILQQTKLMCVFVPGANISDAVPSVASAYFYSHKMIMNPTNETKLQMTIPFVSDRPFLTTDSSTGMFYIMMYQPLVNSFGSTNPVNIYGKIFVSADFDLHETIPLPIISGGGGGGGGSGITPTSLLWITAAVTTDILTLGVSAGSNSFITDSGILLNAPKFPVNAFTHKAYVAFKPVCAAATMGASRVYNKDTCRTLFGTPSGSGNSRTCGIIAENSALNATAIIYQFYAVASDSAIWLETYGDVPIAGMRTFFDGVYDLAGTYTSIFSNTMVFPASFDYESLFSTFTTRM